MKLHNVTPGFKGWNDIEVYAMTTIDGVRFMSTSDGIDIMNEDAEQYLVPMDSSEYMYWMAMGVPIQVCNGVPVWVMELQGEPVRELNAEERKMMKEHVSSYPCVMEWKKAARRL